LSAAGERGIRIVSYARPSYGGSTPLPGRSVAAGAEDAARVVDALGVDRFAVMGYSGGGPHALACAALLPGRVTGVVTVGCLAPYTEEFDWFAGMASPDALRASIAGRDARARFAETDEFDPRSFTAADLTALSSTWGPVGDDAQLAESIGPDGLIDDDVAFVTPWRIDLAAITAPVLLIHGAEDRIVPYSHSEWLHRRVANSQVWRRSDDGHVSVLDACPDALDWLLE
jgi:pimeloyl-ACP methyl ester carboxylesterase